MENAYLVTEFDDGLQLIPALWYNADRNSSIWPTHFKSKFRINKAIMTREMPQNECKWDELPVKRIFSRAGSYSEGMEKLVLAEDTSHIDDVPSDELREKKKKRRRMKAQKRMLSSSSDEDTCSSADDRNQVSPIPAKRVPAYPEIGHFVSPNKTPRVTKMIQYNVPQHNVYNNLTDIVCQSNISCTASGSARAINTENGRDNTKEFIARSNGNTATDNGDTNEYNKLVLRKLNKTIYILKNIENTIDKLEEKMQHPNYCHQDEIDIQLPITTFAELTLFEDQSKEVNFKNEAINTFKLVGGNTAHIMIRNILRRALTDDLAQYFSWAGMKSKKSFQHLDLARIIIQAVRTTHKHVSDAEIADSISKWLAQAPIRIERSKKIRPKENNGSQENNGPKANNGLQ